MSKATRMNISVPQDLKGRMDAVEEDVNWSALACRAFEQKLAEIITRKGAKEMGDVIARLRASKANVEDSRYKQGVEAGQEWAKSGAEYEELQILAAYWGRVGINDWMLIFDDTNASAAYGPAESLYFALHPETHGERGESDQFWETAVGPDDVGLTTCGEYVRGFAEGAMMVWNQIKDQL